MDIHTKRAWQVETPQKSGNGSWLKDQSRRMESSVWIPIIPKFERRETT